MKANILSSSFTNPGDSGTIQGIDVIYVPKDIGLLDNKACQ